MMIRSFFTIDLTWIDWDSFILGYSIGLGGFFVILFIVLGLVLYRTERK